MLSVNVLKMSGNLGAAFSLQWSQSSVSAKYIYYGQDVPVRGSTVLDSPFPRVNKVGLVTDFNCFALTDFWKVFLFKGSLMQLVAS